ncbi:hypothetical protein SRHO_G00058550 [Serrasalmus rhombeus]
MEHSLTTYSGDVLALQAKVELLTKEVSALDAKCDELESRFRRQNIRIVGVPEGETFSLTNSAVSKKRRHPIVARLHCYSDCAEILKRARQRQWITISGMRFAVFPDYTAKVARARAAFNEARKLLRDVEAVRYSLLFPPGFGSPITARCTFSLLQTISSPRWLSKVWTGYVRFTLSITRSVYPYKSPLLGDSRENCSLS